MEIINNPTNQSIFTDTAGIKALIKNAAGRNRSLSPEEETKLAKKLDPIGTHVMALQMVHEHVHGKRVEPHFRTMWYIKLKETVAPVELWLDVDMSAFKKYAFKVVREEVSGKNIKEH